MIKEPVILLHNLVLSLSDALDLVHPNVAAHQQRVAYITLRLAMTQGCDEADQAQLMYAAALHDIGILSVEDKLKAVTLDYIDGHKHSDLGALMLSEFDLFGYTAELIKWHHRPWEADSSWGEVDQRTRELSNMLHLADLIDRKINKSKYILHQSDDIAATVISQSGKTFAPHLIAAFKELAEVESFWLDIVSQRIYTVLRDLISWPQISLQLDQLSQISAIFSRVVDFRSKFTATHSVGVSCVAEQLARHMAFEDKECRLLRVAGFMHDLGKVAIPNSILDKPGKLDKSETARMRGHTYFTYQMLQTIGGFEEISQWAALHHERLDGRGYPFHLKGDELSLGSRIMCVADVFTAISEDRPYRKGMNRETIESVLRNMVQSHALDGRIVDVLLQDFDVINDKRQADQQAYSQQYRIYSDKFKNLSGI